MYAFLGSIAGKIGLGLLAAIVVGGSIYLYNARQQSIGENRVEARHAEAVQAQTEQVKIVDTKLDDQRLQAVEKASAEKDAFNAKLIESNRAYVAANAKLKAALAAQAQVKEVPHDNGQPEAIPNQCLVPDNLLDRVDELGRMLNRLSDHRVPGDPGTASQPEAEGAGPVACDTLVQRIEVLTSRLGNTMIEHRELWDYSVKQYETYTTFKRGLPYEIK